MKGKGWEADYKCAYERHFKGICKRRDTTFIRTDIGWQHVCPDHVWCFTKIHGRRS